MGVAALTTDEMMIETRLNICRRGSRPLAPQESPRKKKNSGAGVKTEAWPPCQTAAANGESKTASAVFDDDPCQVFVAPVDDDSEQMIPSSAASWQLLSVSLHRAANLGFGIAISGGRDNPHFTSGDPVVVISDVVPNGPAWGLLQLNDRILSANSVSFENIDYAHAVEIIKNAEQINMIVKRRVAMPVLEFEQRTLKFTLSKSRKKDDFGIVVGCKFYIKEIRNPKLAEKDPGLREGDSVLRINGQCVEDATLEEVNKWLERSRDKLCLVIQRDVRRGTSRWPSQNTVYERVGSVSATPRHSPSPLLNHQPVSNRASHEYVNSPRWRPDGSLDERRVSSPASSAMSAPNSAAFPVSSNGHEYEFYSRQQLKPEQEGVRTVTFRKVGGSVGVRVIGGNEVGVFVSAVAADSPAAIHGVRCGDRILEVNGRNMRGVTRESAVQLLLALDDRVSLKLEHARNEFEHVRNNQLGDNFYIRSHFTKEKKSSPLELAVNEGDIFHVTDTLFGGTVGLWQAARVYSAVANKGEPVKGVIPNQTTAETIAREMRRIADIKARNGGGGTLLRRKLDARRTKSLPKNMVADPAELSASIPLPAYERVALNTPSFHRPIVLFGPLADIARQMFLTQYSARFVEPESDGGVIRLSSVDHVIASGKHCILDISIESVERLQLAQYAPIVVLLDVDGRSKIRDIRKKTNAPHLSSRKLAEQATQIKKHHAHLLSATVDATNEEGWFEALRELIVHLQQRRLWMPEFPPNLPLEDVLLFPLSTKGDGDESLRSEYSEYGGTKRDDSLSRSKEHMSPMTRSIYDWDSNASSLPRPGQASGEGGSEFPWATMPRRPEQSMSSSNEPSLNGGSFRKERLSADSTNGLPPPRNSLTTFSSESNGSVRPLRSRPEVHNHQPTTTMFFPTTPNGREPLDAFPSESNLINSRSGSSPGYYHVKQLLNDDSLYQDARIANEIANVRLREEARLRDERLRDDQRIAQLQRERYEGPIQAPTADMYTFRDEQATSSNNASILNNGHHAGSVGPAYGHTSRISSTRDHTNLSPRTMSAQPRPTIAPKPSLYTDSVIRNRWNDSPLDARDREREESLSQAPPAVQSAAVSNEANLLSRSQYHLRTNGSVSPATASIALTVASTVNAASKSPSPPENNTQHGKENVEDEEPIVVEESTALVGSEGAVLKCVQSQVELRIPPGAIPDGEKHEIYVKVCREGDSPPIDKSKGETLLSPLVMCGPQGLKFLKQCELRLPHTGGNSTENEPSQWSFSLKAGEGGQWKHMEIEPSSAADDRLLSVPISHF
ncbi:unnamed protein product [Caenorhabditis auriculariae]|uniref:Uncharacterized protein n=1 Tax=Caenorhabditis auriculariae TaxID=2777116 RepID=A0A8S1GQ92_9PELO|nr:unnamed protein product [Caenorhabditis auriculariae]